MPENASGGMHIRNAKNRPQAKTMRRLTYLLSAIKDTNILLAKVAQLIVATAQTARYRETPAANIQFTVCGQ